MSPTAFSNTNDVHVRAALCLLRHAQDHFCGVWYQRCNGATSNAWFTSNAAQADTTTLISTESQHSDRTVFQSYSKKKAPQLLLHESRCTKVAYKEGALDHTLSSEYTCNESSALGKAASPWPPEKPRDITSCCLCIVGLKVDSI